MMTEMEHNLMTYVSNIYTKNRPALFKDFGFINENIQILTENRTKLLILMLTNQIQKGSPCL